MMRKMITMVLALVLAVSLAACGSEEMKETTLTGMVVSVDGTVVSLMETDGTMADMDFSGGERPQMPEGMEGFEGFEGFGEFNPEEFGGTLPEGETFPQRGEGEMPQMPDGMEFPEGMTIPADGEMPEFDGEMPDFGGQGGGMFPGFSEFSGDVETTEVDIADAHISLEIDGGKASGSLEDVVPGTFVTVTLNSKGKATYVLVSEGMSFSGRGMRQSG